MNEKKKKNIRGWLPKEPSSFSSGQQAKPIYGKMGAVSAKKMGGMALGSLLLGFTLLAAPYLLFPGNYTPKADSAWGYSEPATIEAWLVLGAAIGLIFLSVFAFTLYGVKLKGQGSKWMKFTYWVTPRQEGSYPEQELFKVTIATNLLIVGVFTGLVVYSVLTAVSFEALFSVMVVFSVVIAVVNLVLHEFARKKPMHKTEANA
jgi:hypothetical protein